MLKFAAGAIVGWIAARSVPPAPLAPPTLDELVLLAQKGKVYYDKAVQKIQESPDKD